MKRKIIWSLVAFMVIATLLALWFMQNFEQVPAKHWENAQKEAVRNPFLALERLFGQLGRPLVRIKTPAVLDSLPASGVLILDNNRRRNLNPARAERVLELVRKGGYLIVAAEYAGDDPLLTKLGVSKYREAQLQCKTCKTDTPTDPATDAPKNVPVTTRPKLLPTIEIRLPESNVVYHLKRSGEGLTNGTLQPIWRAGVSETRSSVLHYAWGSGQISVIDNLYFLHNFQLDDDDHAELIWALLQRYQPQGEIRLASRLEVPTLWQWLAESAWTALISLALLIALWLWRIVPRFGGTLAPAAIERRDLLQHLAAIGRSVWREGGIAHWLAVVRQAVHKRLALRHPHLNEMEPSRQHDVLAKMIERPTKDLRSALTPGPAQTPNEFTKAMQTLQSLDQHL